MTARRALPSPEPEAAAQGTARHAVAPRAVPVGRRWVPRAPLTPSRALPAEAPPALASDVIVWSHGRDAVGLAALFLVSFSVVRVVSGRGADLGWWLPAAVLTVLATLGLLLVRRHRVEADADGVRRLGPRGWRLRWDEVDELRLDGTRNEAGRAGWFRFGPGATSVALEVVPGPRAGRRAEAHAALRSDLAPALGELARHHGVRTRQAAAAAPRRAAS